MMKIASFKLLLASLCLPLLTGPAFAATPAGDAARGKTLFASQCAACHADQAGQPDRQGPDLWGIYGAKPGQEKGFAYSDDFAKTDFVWDESHLDSWLTKPAGVIPDSYMMYAQPDAQIRADIIAYLKTLKAK